MRQVVQIPWRQLKTILHAYDREQVKYHTLQGQRACIC